MDIAQVTINFRPVISGTGQVVLDTSRELARRGHRITVLTQVPHNALGYLPKREEMCGFTVVRFPSYFTGLKLRLYDPYVQGLVGHLLKHDYDIIHCHSYNYFHSLVCGLVKRSRLKRSKMIVQTHHPFHYATLPSPFASIYRMFRDAHTKFILNTCDQVLAITPHDIAGIARLGITADKVSEMPVGIWWSEYQGNEDTTFRQKHGVGENERTVLFLGRLDNNKGLPFLINVAAKLTHEGVSFKLVVAGEDFGMRGKVEQLVHRLEIEKHVILTGRLTDVEKVNAIKACDLLVLPSSYEGLGLVLLEAQAAGKPVIASKTGGMPYALEDRQTGFLVSYGDYGDLSGKLRLLLENQTLRKEMGRKGREFARRFDYQLLTARLIEIYENVLLGNQAPVTC